MSFFPHIAANPYIRLMRLHQPVGIWLLLWPCWWSVTLASPDFPPLWILLLFAMGAILMRSAGCIINDIADREFDKQVERTRTRPLASGELQLKQALILLLALLLASLGIVLFLGKAALLWASLSLLPVCIYPFMKRISWWPQLFLGLTFNWGALMGWATIRGDVELPALSLYIGGIFWTLGYDTIYAHQDKVDDAKIGVKSTALRLGRHTKQAVSLFYTLAILFWLAAGLFASANVDWYVAIIFACIHFIVQLHGLNIDSPSSCRKAFLSNTQIGWILFLGTIIGK